MNALDKALFQYHNDVEKSVADICKENNIYPSDLYKILDYKDEKRTGKKSRLYYWDITKLEVDSKEKYYWLGFIAADGYVNSQGLRIELKRCDKTHLEKIKNFLECSSPIKERINNNGCKTSYLDIHDVRILPLVSKYNIRQNKSLIFTIPENKIPKKFILDFCRGLIDGDGCIRVNNHQQISLSFCAGNYRCVEQINQILEINNKVSFSGNCYRVQVTGNKKAKNILDNLYRDSINSTRLDRKYYIYYNKFYGKEIENV